MKKTIQECVNEHTQRYVADLEQSIPEAIVKKYDDANKELLRLAEFAQCMATPVLYEDDTIYLRSIKQAFMYIEKQLAGYKDEGCGLCLPKRKMLKQEIHELKARLLHFTRHDHHPDVYVVEHVCVKMHPSDTQRQIHLYGIPNHFEGPVHIQITKITPGA